MIHFHESACNSGDPGSIPGSGRSPGEGNGNLLHHSCLENPTFRGTWQVSTGGQVIVTENIHTVAAVFIPNSGSWGNQNLRKTWLPKLWTGVECAWANAQGPVSHYLFPLKLHPFPPDSLQRGPQHPAEVLGGCILKKKAWAVNPITRRTES